ncbi:alpha-actinin-like protein 1 isoform X1 [Xenia sp. Carnegie-2017]|uniref:alpha-actinin-like protein 1 isoform X1 n=1 Tax=Xenia sp. Carnegie-2017 TaxID=2897299 RepID=UPI001F03D90C|nr:alpha-actinin-like protein 1 isoform X1 [Xenia sp. Carnegie-2017]
MPRLTQDRETRIYTKWINSKLKKEHISNENSIEDLQDGRVLISLVEVLLNTKINAEEPKLKIHKLENVKKVLELLKENGLPLTMKNEEIVEGNDTQILALLWEIILHFQIYSVVQDKQSTAMKLKDTSSQTKPLLSQVEQHLIKWMQNVLQGMSDFIMVDDLESSWQDGLAFVFLLYVFRPSSVDLRKALKMSAQEKLMYSFSVAEEEFGVPCLLDPLDVKEGEVDKERMLIYFSSLYEVLRNHEVKKPSVKQEIEHESITLRIGNDAMKVEITSKNKSALLIMKLYYTVLYSMKGVEERIKKIAEKEPSQERARELREMLMEMQEIQKMIDELNDENKKISSSSSFDQKEILEVLKEFRELSKRWSALVKYNGKELFKQPATVVSRSIVNSAQLKIGDYVIEITSVSSNDIVVKFVVVYYEVITIIQMIEDKMKIIEQEQSSLKTSQMVDEIAQMMNQVQEIKIIELKDLMSEMKIAENVDSEELDELNKEFKEFQSYVTRMNSLILKKKNEPFISFNTPSMEIDGDDTKRASTHDIVLSYKTAYPNILSAVERLEKRINKMQAENPSQKNAKALKVIDIEMQELHKVLCQMHNEMSTSLEVDPKEFSKIHNELEKLIERWLILVKNNNKEIMRQPAIVREIKTRKTAHSAHLTIGDKVIEIESVSSNGIVIKYKILYYEIITIIEMIESNIKVIIKEEPSQKTAALLDENIQRLHQLQKNISELHELISKIEVAKNVDSNELKELLNEHEDFIARLTEVNAFISNEKERQPVLVTKTVYETSREEEIVRSLHSRVKLILT